MKKKTKSMSPKQILAYIAFIIAVVWTLKFVFELSSSGVKQITSSGSKQVTSSSERKICYLNFEGKKWTGEFAEGMSSSNIVPPQPASTYCVESNWQAGFACEPTTAYRKAKKKYEKCIDSGGKDPLEDVMAYCSARSVDVASEIRGQWYKDCMKAEGW